MERDAQPWRDLRAHLRAGRRLRLSLQPPHHHDRQVKVPVKIAPASGNLDTVFTVRLGNIGTNADFEYVVQRMKNNGPWKNWRATENETVTFDPSSPGTYSFRSRIRRISDGASTGYSPKRSITVSS